MKISQKKKTKRAFTTVNFGRKQLFILTASALVAALVIGSSISLYALQRSELINAERNLQQQISTLTHNNQKIITEKQALERKIKELEDRLNRLEIQPETDQPFIP